MISQVLTTASPTTAADDHFGGCGTLFAVGAFGGGSVKLQASIDGGVWFDCKDTSGTVGTITTDGIIPFAVAPCKLRAVLVGSAAGTVTAKIAQY